MTFSVSLPDSLRSFLQEEMREGGHESIDQCAAYLLQRAEERKPPRQTFAVDGQNYRLTRLSDWHFHELAKSSIAIEEDFDLQFALARSSQLNLAETYALCRHLFGERGRSFDHWKGGFAFPLALEVPRAARRPAYLFHVLNYRSGVEYRLRKLVARDDERLKKPIYYPPEASEFSREEIRYFVSFFVGFLEGYWESWGAAWKDPFLLAVQSNLILFGFDGDEFFNWQFASAEDFDETGAELTNRLPAPGYYGQDWDS